MLFNLALGVMITFMPAEQLPCGMDEPSVIVQQGKKVYEAARAQLEFEGKRAVMLIWPWDKYRLYCDGFERDRAPTKANVSHGERLLAAP